MIRENRSLQVDPVFVRKMDLFQSNYIRNHQEDDGASWKFTVAIHVLAAVGSRGQV